MLAPAESLITRPVMFQSRRATLEFAKVLPLMAPTANPVTVSRERGDSRLCATVQRVVLDRRVRGRGDRDPIRTDEGRDVDVLQDDVVRAGLDRNAGLVRVDRIRVRQVEVRDRGV